MKIADRVHSLLEQNYDPDDLPAALVAVWDAMTEEQQYEFLDGLDAGMREECAARWESQS